MSFDPMAAAVDWLDAFRSADLECLANMFADKAVIECRCCCAASVTGEDDLRAFWERRLADCAPFELDDLQPSGDGVMLTYAMRGGLVAATLDFDAVGQIVSLQCDLVTPATQEQPGAGAGLAVTSGR